MSVPAVALTATSPRRPWLGFALATVALWGVWGALSPLSAEHEYICLTPTELRDELLRTRGS